MNTLSTRLPHVKTRAPAVDQFREEVVRGLRAPHKELPCKFFYDEVGSDLFEQITELEEYYPTRTELAIMRQHAAAMAALLGENCLLIEFGSGSSLKTRLLLDHLTEPAAYVPVDISGEHLKQTARALAKDYPGIEITPLCADFTRPLRLPPVRREPARRVVYFPGSTLGNFTPTGAIELLRRIAALAGADGGLLLGADLCKEPRLLHAAYNDAKGVTAAFNLNLLERINRELDGDFRTDRFWHYAFYNPRECRVEMHLVSRCDHLARIGADKFFLTEGESIRTEYSYKYTISALKALASAAGFTVRELWTDEQNFFSVLYLAVR